MKKRIQLLDCTLRDGAYIVDSQFGLPAIKGIIKKLQDANIDIIECGWLKNNTYIEGSTFFHVPYDILQYMPEKRNDITYVAMIDWDRYDINNLPECDGQTIDAIRVVFPHEKYKDGIKVGREIKKKGYKVYFQAANTLAYSDNELIDLVTEINEVKPEALSVVDTFGAMYHDDLHHIVSILNKHLIDDIHLGFHSHNNQQLSFALSIQLIEELQNTTRSIIVDSSLCGMGRGAGNTTTELLANYINSKYNGNYDMNVIMDAIDTYMGYFLEHYQWGYSIPYFISGMFCAHVNNIAYLSKNHRTNAKDMRNIIESLSDEERKKYDYDLLEQKYMEYRNSVVDDELGLSKLRTELESKTVLLLLPGKSIIKCSKEIQSYIEKEKPVVIGVNSIITEYQYDYLFFSNSIRYDYAKEVYTKTFNQITKIVSSSIKNTAEEKEILVNYNLLVKRGWEHFDNAGIMCLRMLNKIHVSNVVLAGFDGFEDAVTENYADASLPHIHPGKKWDELNDEVKSMLTDFKLATQEKMKIIFLTKSKYNE